MSYMFNLIDFSSRPMPGFALSSIVPGPLDLFIRVHHYWKWKEHLKDVARNNHTIAAGAAGYVAQNVVKSSNIVVQKLYGVPAQLLLIGAEYYKSLDQYFVVNQVYNRQMDICTCRKTFHVKTGGLGGSISSVTTRIFDSATVLWMKVQFQLLGVRINQTTKYTFTLVQEVFTLSNCLLSLAEATRYDDPAIQELAGKTVFLNAGKIHERRQAIQGNGAEALKAQKGYVATILNTANPRLEELQKHMGQIDSVFETVAQPIYAALDYSVVKGTVGLFTNAVVDLGAKLVFTFTRTVPQSIQKEIVLVPPVPTLKSLQATKAVHIPWIHVPYPSSSATLKEIQERTAAGAWKLHGSCSTQATLAGRTTSKLNPSVETTV